MTNRNAVGGKGVMDCPQAARGVNAIAVDAESVGGDGDDLASDGRDLSRYDQGSRLLGGCCRTIDHSFSIAAGKKATVDAIATIGKRLCGNLQALCVGDRRQSATGGGKQYQMWPVCGQTAADSSSQILVVAYLVVEGSVQLQMSQVGPGDGGKTSQLPDHQIGSRGRADRQWSPTEVVGIGVPRMAADSHAVVAGQSDRSEHRLPVSSMAAAGDVR